MNYLAKLALLVALYFLAGRLGLLLAVPPGYATLIWPPSGIALGMLVVHGWRLWFGVLLGSWLLNGYVSGVYSAENGIDGVKAITALAIAIGSSAQALLGYALIRRFVGWPLRLDRIKDVFKLFTLAGPVACLTAASVGVAALYLSGAITAAEVVRNWGAWWSGDVFGVLVFLPLLLVTQRGEPRLAWRNQEVHGLPLLAALMLVLPLGLTFYTWKVASQAGYQQSRSRFDSLAVESEKALMHRLSSYENAALGAAAFMQGSQLVSREQWRHYVQTIRVRETFPGINGIGWIERVPAQQLPEYLSIVRADGAPDFDIHPADYNERYDIIRYIEPALQNSAALGLNLAFEKNRRDAADLSADTGRPAITRRIVLVQDEERTPGFLLMHPLYHEDLPIDTMEHRRAALKGWVYAPFIAKNFLAGLTRSQGDSLNLRIYDGREEAPGSLIFGSGTNAGVDREPAFSMRKQMQVMQREWLIVWDSTPSFEQAERTNAPLLILIGGLLFTTLFGLFLIVLSVRRAETMEWLAGERQFALPLFVLVLLAAGSYALYATLQEKELGYARKLAHDEARKIEQLLSVQTHDKLYALRRMAQRWTVGGGTPFTLWQNDARNYTQQLTGLKAVQWVDPSYHVRWVEPALGNESIVGLDVLFDSQRAEALKGAANKDELTLLGPIMLVQGYPAFIAYLPLSVQGKFDGFLAGVFSIREFFDSAIGPEVGNAYAITMSHGGEVYFDNGASAALQADSWASEQNFQIHDKQWTLRIVPTQQLIESQKSSLPLTVLIAGVLIAALSALSLRYILVSRLRAAQQKRQQQALETSEETFRTAMEYAPIGQALVAIDGRFMKVNPALCRLLGYPEDELLATDSQSITYPDDLERDRDSLRQLLAGALNTYQLEKRYFRRSGQVMWALLSVSGVERADGQLDYLIAQIHDITARKDMERIKSEFISVISHELRTPLTSIRGSLGLLLGVHAKDLPAKVKGLLEIGYNNCERLILLINDILDIDKIASGHMRFDMNDESLAALTLQGVRANDAYARKFDNRICLHEIDERIVVHVDAARYIQVLSNLLSNAAKFSPRGGTIDVSVRIGADHVRICVQDHGPGIPEEFQPRIFEKFSQADSSATRQKGGTGLGLHITRQLVEHMHGRIGYETHLGKGTVFWIEFPLVTPSTVAEVRGEPDQRVLRSDRLPGARAVVLHVENDLDLSRMLASALQDRAEVITATTLEEAERLLRQQVFSAIILDVMMPDGSGLDLLMRLDQLVKPVPPVLILSGDMPPLEVCERVAAVMIKTRTPEHEIADRIAAVLDRVADLARVD